MNALRKMAGKLRARVASAIASIDEELFVRLQQFPGIEVTIRVVPLRVRESPIAVPTGSGARMCYIRLHNKTRTNKYVGQIREYRSDRWLNSTEPFAHEATAAEHAIRSAVRLGYTLVKESTPDGERPLVVRDCV